MKIGIDCRALATGRTSGVEEYLRQLLRHLIPLDRSISYVLFGAGQHPRLPDDEAFLSSNVQVSLHRRSGRLLLASTRMRGKPYLDQLVGGVDAFFFPHIIAGATSPGCPRVLTVHDLSFERFPEHLSLVRRLWHRAMAPATLARSADHIIAVSRSTALDIQMYYGIASDQVTVVHSGVSNAFRPKDYNAVHTFRTERGLPERFILAMCTREPRKNLGGLLAAFERLAQHERNRDVHLFIVGPPGWNERAFRSAIRHSPVRKRVHVHGPVDPEERPLWYASASVVAYPSFFEGFGFPPLEAMATGTPVVVSQNASLPEVVGEAGMLINPYDAHSIASAMDAVLTDASLAERCRIRGRERAASFTWERAARQTLDVIASAAR